MTKQKIYVQESYVYEYEVDTDEVDIEEFIKEQHYETSVGINNGYCPVSIQYMVEDSEWVELHDM